jgi:hypothetical protein
MAGKLIVVRVAYDPEARVWWIESSDLFGLNAEAPTLEELRAKLPDLVAELVPDNEPTWMGMDIVVDMIASTRLPAVAAA